MKSEDKAEMLKNTIEHLYSKEGRSISYISKLLEINRHTVSVKLRQWNTAEPKTNYYMKPSTLKNLNKHRQKIKSLLDRDTNIEDIAEQCNIPLKTLSNVYLKYDKVLSESHQQWKQRRENKISLRRAENNYFEPLQDEKWRPLIGYPGYEVSNLGRVRRYVEKQYRLVSRLTNVKNNKLYSIVSRGNKRKSLSVDRLIAQTFIDHSPECNIVNHIDGDVSNNKVSNLEWVSENNDKHTCTKLDNEKNNSKKRFFEISKFKNKYQFKTVAALARFIGKSEN